jgi:4-amino-4-deoxy-L-arabinose transferase-like glycosyltransferase
MRAGFALAGDNPFGARLPSTIAGAAMCLAVWGWGRRMFGGRAGRWAALILATAPIVVTESKLATTDAPLALWIVLAQWALWELSRRPSWFAALGFWVCLSLSILTKGPVGPAIIGVSAIFAWWWGGGTSYLARLRWLPGLALFAALTAPWFVAIEFASHGDFHRVMIGDQVLRRASTQIESHPGFPGYYLGVTALLFFPWSALIPATIRAAWTRRRDHSDFGFLLGWVVGPLIMFEIARTKLVHYYFPSYPALALLIGWYVAALAAGRVEAPTAKIRRLGLSSLLFGVGGAWVVGSIVLAYVLPAQMRAPCLAIALLAAIGLAVGGRFLLLGRYERATGSLVAVWSLLGLVLGGWLLPAAESNRISVLAGRELRRASARVGLDPVLVTFKPPGLIYQAGHPLAVMKTTDGLIRHVEKKGAVLAALNPREFKYFHEGLGLEVEALEVLKGFDVEKFRKETILITRVRYQPRPPTGRPPSNLSMAHGPIVR